MICRVSSKNKKQQAKMINSAKNKDQTEKRTVQRNRKQRRRESNPGLSARASNSLTTVPQ